MPGVLQSGDVTPTHLVTWTTDGVVQDAGVSVPNLSPVMVATFLQVNFNSTNNDNEIGINLPPNYTRYRIHEILVSGATASLSSATCGVFTQTGGTGVAVVAGNTALTITTSLIDTNNNMQSLTIADQNTMALSDAALYFRTQTAQGSPALANVSVYYEILP